jgi:hypothetical protein
MDTNSQGLHLLFHSPCFDGAASAAMASDYFELTLGSAPAALIGVNYHLKDQWLSMPLARPFAVVDFLYHPEVDFWMDHHPTTFLTEALRIDFEAKKNPRLVYDKTATSCALLLWGKWGLSLGDRREHYQELVQWADLIDSAHYQSVEQAITLDSPALQINLALGVSRDKDFSKKLVALFRSRTLEEIAALPEIQSAFLNGRSLQERGLQKLRNSIRLTDEGIAVFEVDSTGVLVNRYAPFYFYPQARYSAGITRGLDDAKITVMRNPWREFPSAPLGQFSAVLGGGGHQRVGSIVLRGAKASEAGLKLNQLLQQIIAWEKQQSPVEVK